MTGRQAPILELVVFVSGAVLLSIELLATRLLAPWFGNSIYVWGSCIGTFLAALSVGYGIGGRVADRHPSDKLFAAVVFSSGLLVVPIPLLSTPVLGTIAYIDFGSRANPLLGAILLFLVPSVVMGMVTPFAVRLRARDLDSVGRTSGSLYAIGTAGSIAGTLLTSFVLIDSLGVRAILYLMGLALIASAALAWVASRRARAVVALLSSTTLVACVLARPSAAVSLLPYTRDTAYHRITVRDVAGIRYLELDDYRQSAVDLGDPSRAVFAYTDYLHLPIVFVPEPRRVTLIGLGGGTITKHWLAEHADVELMTVAELDPAVIDAARRWFDLPVSDHLRIEARDGRLHLASLRDAQDVILMDAYLVDTLPAHLATRELFALARSRLAPGGVLASNVIGTLRGPKSRLFRAVYKTMREVFRTIYVFPVTTERDRPAAADGLRNIVLVATDAARITREEIRIRAGHFARTANAATTLHEDVIDVADVPSLTDDYAPVEGLIPPR